MVDGLSLGLSSSASSPSSACFLPMPFALNCRMVKGSPTEDLVVVGDGSGFGICGVGRESC